ncbi:MAG: hypothetical protein Q4A04_09035 [Eubacteriales bacterium]|nr:hypothetical protein [Eubacteriales bacterium]
MFSKRILAIVLSLLMAVGFCVTSYAETEGAEVLEECAEVISAEAVEATQNVKPEELTATTEPLVTEELNSDDSAFELLGIGGAAIRFLEGWDKVIYKDKTYILSETGSYTMEVLGIDLTQDLEVHSSDESVAEAFFNEGMKKQSGSYPCLNLFAYKEGKTKIEIMSKGNSAPLLNFVINVPKRESFLMSHNYESVKNGSSVTIFGSERFIAFENLQLEDALFEYSENTFSEEPELSRNGDGQLLMGINGDEGGSVHVKVSSKSEPSVQAQFTVHRMAINIETDSATGITHANPGVAFSDTVERLFGALSVWVDIPKELRTGDYMVYAEYRFRDKDQKVLKTVKDVWEVSEGSGYYEYSLVDAFEDQQVNDVEVCVVLVNREADVSKINESWYTKRIQQRGFMPAGKYSADVPVEFEFSIEKEHWAVPLGKEATIKASLSKDAKDVTDLSCYWVFNSGEKLAQIVKGQNEDTLTFRANDTMEGRLGIIVYLAWTECGERKWGFYGIRQTIGKNYSGNIGILCDGVAVMENNGALQKRTGDKSALEAVEGHYFPIGFDAVTRIEWTSSDPNVAEVTQNAEKPEKAEVMFKTQGTVTLSAQAYQDETRVGSSSFQVVVESSGGSGGGGAAGGPKAAAKAGVPTFSKNWEADAAGVWRIKDKVGNYVTSAWLCDDAVTTNGQNVWYLMNTDGTMLAAGLVQDNTGNYYSLEMNHNGYYGMLRYVNGTYDGIYMEFSQKHDGTFGAITNQSAIDALKAKYGVTKFGIGNDRCVYTKTFE